MNLNYILFDLDGTLTASAPGIKAAIRYALTELGRPIPDDATLDLFIGPPLTDSFYEHCGIREAELREAVLLYREYYNTKGAFESLPYPGVQEMLEALNKSGLTLAVCSAKPQDMVERILSHFELRQYFSCVVGAFEEGVRSDKESLIKAALTELEGEIEQAAKKSIMVGDRYYDVEGAKAHGMPCVGVSYGYAPMGELAEAGADYLAASAEELTGLILSLAADTDDAGRC